MKRVTSKWTRSFIAVIIAGCFYMGACEKPADIKLPATEPKLVLHGMVAVGDTFVVALGKTFKSEGLLAKDTDTYVKNGWVTLYEGSVFLDSLKFNNTKLRYISSKCVAAAGKVYTIRAGAAGFPTIESTTIAPIPVVTSAPVRKKRARKTATGIWLDDITYTFDDPPNERNFYIAQLSNQYMYIGCVFTYDPSVEMSSPELILFEENSCIDNNGILYNDKIFNGTKKELTLSADANVMDGYRDPSGNAYRTYLKRYHVTEDYYRYFRSSGQPIVESGPGFFQPFMVKGNVRDGYGLFTVYNMTVDTIR